jgi:hypothetical protein
MVKKWAFRVLAHVPMGWKQDRYYLFKIFKQTKTLLFYWFHLLSENGLLVNGELTDH